jgi:hypothetical protein
MAGKCHEELCHWTILSGVCLSLDAGKIYLNDKVMAGLQNNLSDHSRVLEEVL